MTLPLQAADASPLQASDATPPEGEARPGALAPGEPWWGTFALPVGSAGRWRVGPLGVWLQRERFEWRLAHRRDLDRYCPRLEVEVPTQVEPNDLEVERIMAEHLDSQVRVVPRTADRPVVTKPDGSCRVLGRGRVSFFVSTPMWLRVETAERRETLFEQPVVRPPDTWFGPSTLAGELCYASKTAAVIERERIPMLAGRAVTHVELVNRPDDPFMLQRIALPLPNLTLYRDRDRPELGLWTSPVRFERGSDSETIRVEIIRRAPLLLSDPEEIAPARDPYHRNVLSRAMSAILS